MQRPPVVDDTAGQGQPAPIGQESITVRHEDLVVIGVCVVATPIPEVLTYLPNATPFTTSLASTPSPTTRSRAPARSGW